MLKKQLRKFLSVFLILCFMTAQFVLVPPLSVMAESIHEVTMDASDASYEKIPVPNGDFEDASNTAWTLTGAVTIQSYWDHTYNNGSQGKKISFWSGTDYTGEAYQTITGLENGNYELKAFVMCGGTHNEAYLYAKDFGAEEIKKVGIPNSPSAWVEIALEVTVSNGQMTIGFYDNGEANAWYIADDVTLWKKGVPAPEQPDGIEIPNRGFEDGLASWNTSGNTAAVTTTDAIAYQGTWSLEHKSAEAYIANTYQILTGLENGYYTLTAWTQNGGDQNACYLYGKPSGVSESRTALPKSSTWVKVYVRGLHVTDGTLTIGLYSDANAGNWARMDHIELIKDDRPYKLLKGGDTSQVSYIEAKGGKYYDADGNEKDVFQILKENGHDIVRLRVYNNPGPGRGDGTYYCPPGIMDKEDILKLAKRAKNAGLQILFSFHYSDYWSNGGTQIIPYEWQEQIKNLSSEAEIVGKLEELVYAYTLDVMQAMAAQGTTPEYVSLGNEMQSGILFPYGKAVSGTWPNLARFLNAGYAAVKEVAPAAKVVLHLDDAGNHSKYYNFFDNCETYGVNYDIIGTSYYPFWTQKFVGPIIEFCNDLITKYDKDIMFMETGFNWNPVLPNGQIGQLNNNGPYGDGMSTPEGQRDFMLELFNGLKSVKDGRVIGDLYWDPIFIEVPGVGWAMNENGTIGDPSDDTTEVNAVSNTTLFDFNGKALPVMNAYKYNVDGSTSGIITGVVKGADGRSIANAQVSTTIDGTLYSAFTDKVGNFMIIDLPAGSGYTLTAAKAGYQNGTALSGDVAQGEITKVSLQIMGGAIAGTVTDQNGAPAGGAEVSVTIGGERYTTLSASDGTYVLSDLPEGTGYVVTASKDGYESDSVTDVDVAIGQTASGKNLVITLNSGTITGKVIDDLGNPVQGATVSVEAGGRLCTGITDAEGNYTIYNVTSGSGYTVTARKTGYLEGHAANVTVQTDAITSDVNIAIPRNVGSISGKVSDSAGNLVAGATVTAVSGDSTYTVTTNASGQFTFTDVVAGRAYTLTASKTGYLNGRTTGVAVVQGQTATNVEVRLLTIVTVANASFEDEGTNENPLPGWVFEGTPGSTYRQDRRNFGDDARDGYYAMGSWMETAYISNVYQTITGLQNGKYTLSAYFYNGITKEVYMYAKDTGNPEVRVNIPNVSGWNLVQMDVIVSDGQMTIGFFQDANAGDWICVDAVTLGYYGPVTPSTPPYSGDSGSPSAPPAVNVTSGRIVLPKPVLDSKGTAIVNPINAADFNKALETAKQNEKGTKTVTIDVPAVNNAQMYEVGIAASVLKDNDASYQLKIDTELGKITLPANMLTNTQAGSAGNVTIGIGLADSQNLDADLKARIGNRPVIELNLKVNGAITAWSNPNAPVTVSIPYTPTAEELQDPEHIVVWYIDGNGNVLSVPSGRYDAETGMVTFTTTHFSKYAVSFVLMTFEDLDAYGWARKSIEVLASKGITSGTSKTTFSPGNAVTRADFIRLLVRALDLNAEFASNFDDVKATDYFYNEVGIAKALGIVAGTGNNKFNPRESISREDMMVIAARALNYKGVKLSGSVNDLTAFSDASAVSGYAVNGVAALVKAGFIVGSNGKINPKAEVTRAEAAALIYRLYNVQY